MNSMTKWKTSDSLYNKIQFKFSQLKEIKENRPRRLTKVFQEFDFRFQKVILYF